MTDYEYEYDGYDDYEDDDEDEWLSDEERLERIEQYLVERYGHEVQAQEDEEYLDHLALHAGLAQEALGRQLTHRELHSFADDLEASGGEPFDISHYEVDLGNDGERAEHFAEVIEDVGAEQDAAEGGDE